MAANREHSIEVAGLAKLRRDLKKIDKELGKEVTSRLREIARKIRDDARSRAPYRKGGLKKSIKHSVKAKGASVFSDLDYAPVHEWGGTIYPKGDPIDIEGVRYIYNAVGDHTNDVREQVGEILDRVADHNGFH